MIETKNEHEVANDSNALIDENTSLFLIGNEAIDRSESVCKKFMAELRTALDDNPELRGYFDSVIAYAKIKKQANNNTLSGLPNGLRLSMLDISNCQSIRRMPQNMRVKFLCISGCSNISNLPELKDGSRVECRDCVSLVHIPENIVLGGPLILDRCVNLKEIPKGTQATVLNCRDCRSLERLPEGLDIKNEIDIRNCCKLASLPSRLSTSYLDVTGCMGIENVGEEVCIGSDLDLSNRYMLSRIGDGANVRGSMCLKDCSNITSLPRRMKVGKNLDLRGTGISAVPNDLEVGGDLLLSADVKEVPATVKISGHIIVEEAPLKRQHGILRNSQPQGPENTSTDVKQVA